MARVAWTDERVDDLAGHMDAGFERTSRDSRDLRVEIRGVRGELRNEIGELRREMAQEFQALRTTMWRVGGGMIVALGGAVAAFSLSGS